MGIILDLRHPGPSFPICVKCVVKEAVAKVPLCCLWREGDTNAGVCTLSHPGPMPQSRPEDPRLRRRPAPHHTHVPGPPVSACPCLRDPTPHHREAGQSDESKPVSQPPRASVSLKHHTAEGGAKCTVQPQIH